MKFKGGEFSTGTMRNFQSELTINAYATSGTSPTQPNFIPLLRVCGLY